MASKLGGTAFITGAGSGIGKGAVFAFAQCGVTNLALLDLNVQMLGDTHSQLKAQFPGINAVILGADVSDEASVETAVSKVVQAFGRIDFAISCAGIGCSNTPTHETALEEWQRVIDINQTGVWICQRALIRQMLEQEDLGPRKGRGVIVNVSSMYGVATPPASIPITPYTAAKHAVLAFTKADAKVYGPKGIRINAICPGYVETPVIREAFESGAMKAEFERTPLRRAGTIQEIADSIVFLSSPMSSFMCGAGLVVDGGHSL